MTRTYLIFREHPQVGKWPMAYEWVNMLCFFKLSNWGKQVTRNFTGHLPMDPAAV